jgi:hypothetical protein
MYYICHSNVKNYRLPVYRYIKIKPRSFATGLLVLKPMLLPILAYFFILAPQTKYPMKKVIASLALLLSLMFINAQSNSTEIHKSAAQAPKVGSLYVFVLCAPAREYTKIATIKKTVVAGNIHEALYKYSEYAAKLYPEAEAIIFRDISLNGRDEFDVVKFK